MPKAEAIEERDLDIGYMSRNFGLTDAFISGRDPWKRTGGIVDPGAGDGGASVDTSKRFDDAQGVVDYLKSNVQEKNWPIYVKDNASIPNSWVPEIKEKLGL